MSRSSRVLGSSEVDRPPFFISAISLLLTVGLYLVLAVAYFDLESDIVELRRSYTEEANELQRSHTREIERLQDRLREVVRQGNSDREATLAWMVSVQKSLTSEGWQCPPIPMEMTERMDEE